MATVVDARQVIDGLTFAEAVSAGDLVGYSSGWKKADADGGLRALGVAAANYEANEVGSIFLEATVAGYSGLTAGNLRYLSTTAGGSSDTPASGSAIKQCVGVVVAADQIHYSPTGLLGAALTRGVAAIPITLSAITGAGDVLTNWTPGFAGIIEKVSFAVSVPATTAGKAATLNLEIGTTDLTGGVVSLTSANCTPLGAVVDGTAVTGNNAFGTSDTISVEASSVTAFAEGSGYLLVVYRQYPAAS